MCSSDYYHEDPPVPKDLSRLYHECTEPGCSFCEWRKHNTIDIGCKKLLEEPSMNLCGVDLTSSQIADPQTDRRLSELLWRWILFPCSWLRIRTSLTQIDYNVVEDSLIARNDQPCTSTSVTIWRKPLLSAQHLPMHMVCQRGKRPLMWQGKPVFLRRLEITLNALWRYGQIGPRQGTTSYSLERRHSALIFVNCFRNELLAVLICVMNTLLIILWESHQQRGCLMQKSKNS